MLYFLLRVAEKNGSGSSSGRMADILGTMPIKGAPVFAQPPSVERVLHADRPLVEYWKQYQELRQSNHLLVPLKRSIIRGGRSARTGFPTRSGLCIARS
jgi:hypothetical protein